MLLTSPPLCPSAYFSKNPVFNDALFSKKRKKLDEHNLQFYYQPFNVEIFYNIIYELICLILTWRYSGVFKID